MLCSTVLCAIILTHSMVLLVSAEFRSTNPGGGGAFNSPCICNNNWIVASDLGGIYVSENQGQSWYPVGSEGGGSLLSTHVSSLACLRDEHLLVGTDDGIFRGQTNGRALVHVSPGGYAAALVVAPGGGVVYAAKHAVYNGVQPEIYISNDQGLTFQRTPAAGLPTNFRIVGMRSHPVDDGVIWVISGRGRFGTTEPAMAYYSDDSGGSFDRWDPDQGDVVDVSYSYNQHNLNEVYLTTLDDDRSVGRLFLSYDTGFGGWTEIAFSTISNTDDAGATGVILADATNFEHLRLIDYNYRSGTTETLMWERQSLDASTFWNRYSTTVLGGWSQADEDWGMGSSFQGSLQTIGYRHDEPNTILWSTPQFIYASTDGGQTWEEVVSSFVADSGGWVSRGIDNVVPMTVEPSEADPDLVYTGYLDLGIWRSDDGGTSWKPLNPDSTWSHNWGGKGGNSLTIVADPDRSGVVWAQVAGDLSDPIHLLRSTNRGDTWEELTQGLPSNPTVVESLVLDPTSPSTSRRLYVVVDGDIFLSANDGSSWSMVLGCGDCIGVHHSENALFAFGPQGVWRSNDSGAEGSWVSVSVVPSDVNAGWTPGQHWLFDQYTYRGPISMASRGSDELWVAVQDRDNGGLWYSSNGGSSWTLVYENPFLRSVAVDPVTSEVLVGSSSALRAGGYNAESAGLVIHPDGRSASGWTAMNQNLAWPFCTFVTVTSTGVRWIISPGEGVLFDSGSPVAVVLPQLCFSGDTEVYVWDKGAVSMKSLQLGDKVHVGQEVFQPIYGFGHYAPDQEAVFLEITTSNESLLQISNNHLVFTTKGAIPAVQLQLQDYLFDEDGNQVQVSKIRKVSAKGVFAPFTPSGRIVVSGIQASSFTALDPSSPSLRVMGLELSHHWLAHSFEFPHRFFCNYVRRCATESYVDGGQSTWTYRPLAAATWMLEMRNTRGKNLLLVLSVGVLCLFWLLDQLCRWPISACAAMTLCWFSARAAIGCGTVSKKDMNNEKKMD